MGTTTQDMKADAPSDCLQESPEDYSVSPLACQPSSNRKKRSAQTATPPAKRRRGNKLTNLFNMPVDILFEIFDCLLPHDLLRLSRATKSLRNVLMSRSSTSVWKQARANVPGPPIPECPDGLSEPAFASLIFDTWCHFCGVQGASTVDWYIFTRTCKKCFETQYSEYNHPETLSIFCKEMGIAPEEVLWDIDCLCPINEGKFAMDKLLLILLEYVNIEGEAQKIEWKNAKREEKAQRITFAFEMDDWYTQWKHQRQNDIQDAKDRRKAAILDKLKGEGWADVIDNLSPCDWEEFGKHCLVKQNKNLTDRIWKNIKPEMTRLFSTFRSYQHQERQSEALGGLMKAFREALGDYCATIPHDSITVPISMMAFDLDAIQDHIRNKNVEALHDKSVFDSAFAEIPQHSVFWKADFDIYLLQLLTPSQDASTTSQSDPPDTSTLHLATSLFRCDICGECHFTYKQIVAHRCSDGKKRSVKKTGIRFDLPRTTDILQYVHGDYYVSLCPHRNRMDELLRLCHLPEDTMIESLQEINPLVGLPAPSLQPVMYWHAFLSSSNSDFDNMRVLSYSDIIGVMYEPRSLEWFDSEWDQTEGFMPNRFSSVYGCKYCYSIRPLEFEQLVIHLRTRHDIEITSRLSMEHYFIHPNVPFKNSASYNCPLFGAL